MIEAIRGNRTAALGLVALLVAMVVVQTARSRAVPGPEPGSPDFEVFVRISDGVPSPVEVSRTSFATAEGWDFGGRAGYRCAWVEHFSPTPVSTSSTLDFAYDLDRMSGYPLLQVNDRNGADAGAGNVCGPASENGQAAFDGSGHFPHGLVVTWYRDESGDGRIDPIPEDEFATIDYSAGACSQGYWVRGDEPGEAWLWWDADFPEDRDAHGDGLCSGGPGEPVPTLRAHVDPGSMAEGIGVCTTDAAGTLCGGDFSPPAEPPAELECFAGQLTSELDGHLESFRVCTT